MFSGNKKMQYLVINVSHYTMNIWYVELFILATSKGNNNNYRGTFNPLHIISKHILVRTLSDVVPNRIIVTRNEPPPIVATSPTTT